MPSLQLFKLTRRDGTAVWVNPNQITYIGEVRNVGASAQTILNFGHDHSLGVKEDVADIVRALALGWDHVRADQDDGPSDDFDDDWPPASPVDDDRGPTGY